MKNQSACSIKVCYLAKLLDYEIILIDEVLFLVEDKIVALALLGVFDQQIAVLVRVLGLVVLGVVLLNDKLGRLVVLDLP
jgi:hypothetical protein